MSDQAAAISRTQAKAEPAPAVGIHRTCGCGRHVVAGGQCEGCGKAEGVLHRRSIDSRGPDTAPRIVHDVLQSTGRPLAPATRASVEPLFGRDFSGVRIHNDARAAASAQSVNALAYTVGQNIVFDGPHYSPSTPAGQRLLIHELAHAAQQGNGGTDSAPGNLRVSKPTDPAEREAEAVADKAAAGRPVSVQQQTPVSVHRSVRETAGDISLGLGIASAAAGVVGLATGHSTLGGLGVGLGIAGIVGGLVLRHKPKPPPTSIRIVQVHQVPLDDYAVSLGLRWGAGGVSEIEVSNGDVDYEGSEIEEHFVGGQCATANRSGQGGKGGSTFTVGYGFNNHTLGRPINFPAKRNVFYDQHLRAGKDPDPPMGLNLPCAQQYSMDGRVIAGKSFEFSFDVNRQQVAGENVAVLSLVVNEQAAAQAPPQPAANPPATPSGNTPVTGQPAN